MYYNNVCCFVCSAEIDIGPMEDVESGLHTAVQLGQTVERLLVSFAVRVFANTRVHHMRRNAPGSRVSIILCL